LGIPRPDGNCVAPGKDAFSMVCVERDRCKNRKKKKESDIKQMRRFQMRVIKMIDDMACSSVLTNQNHFDILNV
jgi:hypothetical protein